MRKDIGVLDVFGRKTMGQSGIDTLIVVPWGHPAGWRQVRYTTKGISLDHCTTLPLLLKMFPRAEVFVLVLDSLVEEAPKPQSPSKCWQCYEENIEHLRYASQAKSYKELRDQLADFLSSYVKCLLGDQYKPVIHPVICPAVGRPGGKWIFRGNPRDFESIALYELGKTIMEKPFSSIVVDTTHGVNFMPSLTTRLANRLASLLLARHEHLVLAGQRGVKIYIYNADPVPLASPGQPEMSLNLIAEETHSSIQIPPVIPENLLETMEPGTQPFIELNKTYFEYAGLVASSLYYPLPLLLVHAVSQETAAKAWDVLVKAHREWETRVEILGNTVQRRLALNPDALYLLMLSVAVARRLEEKGLSYPTDTRQLAQVLPLYEAVNEAHRYIIEDELARIEKKTFRIQRILKEADWTPLYLIYIEPNQHFSAVKKRTMIAHAGLQKEIVQVKLLENGQVLLRYNSAWENKPLQQLNSSGLLLPQYKETS